MRLRRVLPVVVPTALAALGACAQDPTAPARPAAAPAAALVITDPPAGGTTIDSVVAGSTPTPLTSGTASVPVAAYTPPAGEGTTVTFDCGDGATASGAVAGGVATAACTYTTPGVNVVTATSGGVTTPAPTYAVVYDPRNGFVTGGGWIASPAGALASAPALVGRASFGFVAKYLPGRQTPDGETEFQFRAANFNFHGGVYQWLVVSGARAQYRGTGRVNNAGSYDFVVTAIDGDLLAKGTPDRFRIRITDKATGVVVYDNRRDGPEVNSDAATELAGGSISIKK